MTTLVMAELMCSVFAIISLISQYSEQDKSEPSKALRLCTLSVFIWLLVDLSAYTFNGPQYPLLLLWIINFFAYIMGGVEFFFSIRYCYKYITEKTAMSKWVFAIPTIGTIFNTSFVGIMVLTGKILVAKDGYLFVVGEIPFIIQLLNILLIIYIPLVASFKIKEIGYKPIVILVLYGLAPSVAIIGLFYSGKDYTAVLGSISIILFSSLLQRVDVKRKLERLNQQLNESNIKLMNTNKEQEAQLSLINSMNKVYFSSFYVDIINDTFIVLNTIDTMAKDINGNIHAQSAFYSICDNLIISDNIDEMKAFVTLSTLNERMKDKEVLTMDYIGSTTGWSQANLIAGERNELGELKTVFVANRKIHDEKERELAQNKMLEDAIMAAENANKAKTDFFFNLSHDIRTPMNAIVGYTKLLEKEANNPEKVLDYQKKLQKSSELLLDLINGILEMSRIESGKVEVNEEYYCVNGFLQEVADVFENLITEKKLTVICKENIKTRHVMSDVVKTHEIISNLLGNAVKYTPEGGNIYATTTEIQSDREGYVLFETIIEDNGIGISNEFLPYIFDSFAREKNTTATKIAGTGLGLRIVKLLVDMMGGTITVESKVGFGTKFTLRLYHKIADERYYKEQETNPCECTNVQLTGKRILLAEDNELNAEIAIEILSGVGLQVEWAKDGIECIDMLRKSEMGYYDVVLMDIQMPNLDGYKATGIIRSAGVDIPIIAMTANAFEEDKANALAAGMNAHIPKPIDVPKLLEVLQNVLKCNDGF